MISLKNIGYEIDSHHIFSGVNFSISEGEKVGLIGPNGAGKTTLLQIIAGIKKTSEGEIISRHADIGLLPQDLTEWIDTTVYDFIATVTGITAVKAAYDQASATYNSNPTDDSLVQFCDAAERLGKFGVTNFEETLVKSLRTAGLSKEIAERNIGLLSGGQRTRVALAAIMASRHDVILLDEPTNNLDLEGVSILESYIKKSKAAFLMVSHDRRFLRNTTQRIIELLGDERGVNQYGLGYDEYIEARELAYTGEKKRYIEHQLTVKSLEASARAKRAQATSAERTQSKAKDNDKLTRNYRGGRAATHLAGQKRGIEARIQRLKNEAPHKPQEPVVLEFSFDHEDSGNKRLLELKNITITYNESTTIGPVTLSLSSNDRLAITGANGTGKSTILKAAMGKVKPSDGEVFLRSDLNIVYIDQDQSLPLPTSTAVKNLLELAPAINREDAIHLLIKLNFDIDEIDTTPVRNMSGGERAKILLASIIAKKASLLILDEPTNNLDIPTIEALQDALQSYRGAILIVSHDRDFLDALNIDTVIPLS